jgi:hypothetical protein
VAAEEQAEEGREASNRKTDASAVSESAQEERTDVAAALKKETR